MAHYTADAHSAQMNMLRQLLLKRIATYSDLARAAGLSNDHANFHIKQLLEAEFVERVPKEYGKYQLTKDGKEYANRMDTDEKVIEKQPKLSVVLDIVNNKGEHIQQERLKHPYFGYWGRPTGKIRWGEPILEAAARELKEETGLKAELEILGIYHKLDYNAEGELLEDKYFCVVRGRNPSGTLLEETEGQRNAWMSDEEFQMKEKTFGGLEDIQGFIDRGEQFVFEKTFTYPTRDY